MRLALLANPENRRTGFFLRACQNAGLPSPVVVSWERFLATGWPEDLGIDAIRVDSPGENPRVQSQLVRRGSQILGRGVPAWTLERAPEHGRIRDGDAWFAGLGHALNSVPNLPAMTPPGEILAMFDKLATRARLESAGVRTPRSLGRVRTVDDVERCDHEKPRVFVKPRYGSSASGVLAVRVRPRLEVTTSVELVDGRAFNSLAIRTYRDVAQIATLLRALDREELHAEAWIPKAGSAGSFDFRVHVVDGRARQVVMRVSDSPLTNLHLGNRRGDVEAFAIRHPDAFARVCDAAVTAAATFSAASCGVDVALDATMRQAWVFEVNAFGDLLPNVLDGGQDTYASALEAFLQKLQR